MKIIHINAGNEYGGGLSHIVSLLSTLKGNETDAELLVLEEGPVAAAARLENIKVEVIQQSSRYDFTVLKKIASYINGSDADVVHTHGPRANMVINILKPFIKAKWIVTLHSNPYQDFSDRGLKGKAFEKINILSVKRAESIITVSDEIKSMMIESGLKETQLHTVYNGIKFEEPLPKDKNKSVFQIIAVGRLEAVKNYPFLFKVLSEIRQLNWKLVLCGDGAEKERLIHLAQDLNIDSRVEFTGWLNEDTLQLNISESDVMVLPSVSEGFPVVLLQAAEQQVPCIATNVGDVKALLNSPEIGWLVESNDTRGLIDSLQAAYEEWETGKLTERGRLFRKTAERFSLSNQSKDVIKIYEAV